MPNVSDHRLFQPANGYDGPTNRTWTSFLPEFEPGWVWLAGAGPGDPGLLTLQAAHSLQKADVILHDALVSADVLSLASPQCEIQFVGKRAGHPSPKQAEITHRLIEAAGSARRVLRLKGGDPFVFGRGAEEALALARARIPFKVLPGVTSGIGGLAYAGLPVTHRDYNQALTFITAHDASGGMCDRLDWTALAKGAPVLVIYMGFRLLDQIADKLISHGRDSAEPVAVVSKATTPEQRTVISTLANVTGDVATAGIDAPVLIVVGDIVLMREELRRSAGMLMEGDLSVCAT